MKGKQELCKRLTEELTKRITTNTNAYKKEMVLFCDYLNKTHNIPVDLVRDIFCLTKQMEYESEFIIYCFCEKLTPHLTSYYFTEREIKVYRDLKFETSEIKFPLHISMIQVTDDQWIGSISARQLLAFKNADLINYNKNAQRTMKHVIKGDVEYYRIALNKNAIYKIKKLYESNVYIPNTITLNIPEESSSFKYDSERKELIIKNIKAFDITDGYHRFVAMCDIMNTDDTFDYPMELRITNFPDSKAQQMIWQEDQKTRMRKIDSDTYNQTMSGTKIADYLNMSPTSNLNGLIARNGGVINASWLAAGIDYMYRLGKEPNSPEVLIETRNNITTSLNRITDENPTMLNKTWSYARVIISVYAAQNGRNAAWIDKACAEVEANYKNVFVASPQKISAQIKILKNLK